MYACRLIAHPGGYEYGKMTRVQTSAIGTTLWCMVGFLQMLVQLLKLACVLGPSADLSNNDASTHHQALTTKRIEGNGTVIPAALAGQQCTARPAHGHQAQAAEPKPGS